MGLEVERVEELTGAAAMLGGRVKTLHPNIHAAILARRDHADDVATLEDQDIRPFDLVCVNLYPFSEVAGRFGVREEEAVEMIDVGGPSMLRGAAKNFAHVAPGLPAGAVRLLCSPSCGREATSRARRGERWRRRRSRRPRRTRLQSHAGSRTSKRSRRHSSPPSPR